MKKVAIISSLALLFMSACKSEMTNIDPSKKTTMEVNMVYDAGTVLQGELIKAEFKVKNTGSYPLVFGEVKGSCTCTVASYPDEPVAPGETAVILAEVDTEKTGTGELEKNVYIMANTEVGTTTVKVKAKVNPRK